MLWLVVAACAGADDEAATQPDIAPAPSLTTIWDAEAARAPFLVVPAGIGRLAVADRDGVFLVDADGTAEAIGRRGEGPGEFIAVGGLGATEDGGLVVIDSRLLRATRLDSLGRLVATWKLQPIAPLTSVLEGAVAISGDTLLRVVWSSGAVHVDGPPDEVALVEHDLRDGSSTTLAQWPGTSWIETPWAAMPASPASGPPPYTVSWRDRSVLQVNDDGCVHRTGWPNGASTAVTCPPIPRVALQPVVPTDSALDEAGAREPMRELLATKHRYQRFEGNHDAVQRVIADDAGCVWLRVVNDDGPYDPILEGNVPSMRPAVFEWWIWDPESERVEGRTHLPSLFEPSFVAGGALYGLLRREDDVRVVAQAVVPADAAGACAM